MGADGAQVGADVVGVRRAGLVDDRGAQGALFLDRIRDRRDGTSTSPHPSPGQTRPVSRPIPRLDTPRFPYKAQKQLQAHIKPKPPATKKNPTQAGHNPSSQLRLD